MNEEESDDLVKSAERPFSRISYTEAIDLLNEEHRSKPFQHKPEWGESLSSEHERWLAHRMDGPVFVTRYPKALKPFYMLATSTSGESTAIAGQGPTVECFDLLLPGLGELAGGSLREHRLENLTREMQVAGLDVEQYQWYLDLRRYGSIPHGGWGMGWDRWICWLTGVRNIRDVVPFPRWKGHCKY